LHEKGGKVNELPCHHNLEQFLEEWTAKTGISGEPNAPLFATMRHGKLEVAQQMAGHESARTTGLYDRRNDAVALDEIERVVF
jgi:hypothetical protein